MTFRKQNQSDCINLNYEDKWKQQSRYIFPWYLRDEGAVKLNRFGREPGVGVLPEKLGGGVRPASQNPITLFMTKIFDIPYPIYDMTQNSKPYL